MEMEPDIASENPGDPGPWLLFAEFNHRVRNELTAALSVLRMARRGGRAQPQSSDLLDQAIDRLENFGLVHHLLDRGQSHGPLRQRLEALCRAIAQSKGAANGVHIAISADDVGADDETAWTVCAVAFELMTNALRHAFRHYGRSLVGVSLREEREWLVLTIADNGSGFAPRDVQSILSNPGLGSAIVAELAERLGGGVSLYSGPTGTAVTVRVSANRLEQRSHQNPLRDVARDRRERQ